MPNCKVSLRMRPEHLVPSTSGPLTIDINNIELFGANTLLHGNLKELEQKLLFAFPGVHELNKIEREMSFQVGCEYIHLFCSSNGQRL